MATAYETVVIFKPTLSDQEVNNYIDKINQMLTSNGAEIENVDLWGKKRLAYPIEKLHEGIYALIVYGLSNAGTAIRDLERFFRLNEDIIRSMTVKSPDMRPRGRKKDKRREKAEKLVAEHAPPVQGADEKKSEE